jgi:soluble lytic murein transglycosylase-like protein
MPTPPLRRRCCAIVLGVMAAWGACAHAAELVTLRSGFTVRCSSREVLSASTVRLHLRAGGESYMDVAAASIAGVEVVADEPVMAVPTVTAPVVDTAAILAESGARHNVNVALLASVVKAESAGNARAVSRTGARGLMQLMPGTAAEMGVRDSFAPAENVNGGSAYLDGLLTRYHDNLTLALAAYNAGPAAVDKYHGVPPYRETQQYVARVIREFNRLVLAEKAAGAAMLVGTQKTR